MFIVGKTYPTRDGSSVRIICVEAELGVKPIVGLVKLIKGGGPALTQFSKEGRWSGTVDNIWDMISDEPSDEELKLLADLKDMIAGDTRATEKNLLDVIRQIRKLPKL